MELRHDGSVFGSSVFTAPVAHELFDLVTLELHPGKELLVPMLDFGFGFHEIDACPPRNLAGESAYIAVALEIGRDGALNICPHAFKRRFNYTWMLACFSYRSSRRFAQAAHVAHSGRLSTQIDVDGACLGHFYYKWLFPVPKAPMQ